MLSTFACTSKRLLHDFMKLYDIIPQHRISMCVHACVVSLVRRVHSTKGSLSTCAVTERRITSGGIGPRLGKINPIPHITDALSRRTAAHNSGVGRAAAKEAFRMEESQDAATTKTDDVEKAQPRRRLRPRRRRWHLRARRRAKRRYHRGRPGSTMSAS